MKGFYQMLCCDFLVGRPCGHTALHLQWEKFQLEHFLFLGVTFLFVGLIIRRSKNWDLLNKPNWFGHNLERNVYQGHTFASIESFTRQICPNTLQI